MKPECAKFDFGKCDETGAVPDFVDFTTDEYSFVIKCPASRHLPMRRKTPPPCRGGGSKSRRGFPPTCHSAKGTKRPLWPPQGEQNGHYGRRKGNKRVVTTLRMANKTAIMAAARETKGHYGRRTANRRGRYAPVGVRPPPPLRGSSPCKAGQFIPAGFDCRHSQVCKSRNSVSLNSSIHFSISVKSPKMRTVPLYFYCSSICL